MTVRRNLLWLRLILPVGLLIGWELAGHALGNIYLPPLSQVLEVFGRDWLFASTTDNLVPSVLRFLVGFLIASTIGIAVGLAVGMSPTVSAYLDPTLEFLRALPAVAVLPVAVFAFGLGDAMRISVIVFGVTFPVLVNAAAGARSVRPERVDVARTFGLNRWDIVRRVVFPSALPLISAGLRVALPIALIMMVVSEIVGGRNGLGFYLQFHQDLFDIPAMFSVVIILGVLGNLVNALYSALESRWLFWAKNA